MPVCEKSVYIHEPTPLQCGQAVLAMLSGKSVDDVVNAVGTSKETTLRDMLFFLDENGIKYDRVRKEAKSIEELPEICILSLETPRCWHWSLYRDGKVLDPEYGVIYDFPVCARKYYWEIKK